MVRWPGQVGVLRQHSPRFKQSAQAEARHVQQPMPHYPDFDTFSKLAATADYVPVYRRILSDVLTPVSAFHKIDDGGSACLFESVIGGEKVGATAFWRRSRSLSWRRGIHASL